MEMIYRMRDIRWCGWVDNSRLKKSSELKILEVSMCMRVSGLDKRIIYNSDDKEKAGPILANPDFIW